MNSNHRGEVSGDPDVPEPTNPDYIRMMAIFEKRAQESHARKVEALAELSASATDEELREEFGLDMQLFRDELAEEQES